MISSSVRFDRQYGNFNHCFCRLMYLLRSMYILVKVGKCKWSLSVQLEHKLFQKLHFISAISVYDSNPE